MKKDFIFCNQKARVKSFFFWLKTITGKTMNKKLCLLLIVFFIHSHFCSAQDKSDVRIMLRGDMFHDKNDNIVRAGLSFELFVTDEISIDYNFSFGYHDTNDYQFYMPIAALLTAYTDNPQVMGLSILTPDGVSFHASPNEFMEITPYVNPLGCLVSSKNSSNINLYWEAGLKTHFKFEELTITPQIGFHHQYGTKNLYISFGISLGLLYEDR